MKPIIPFLDNKAILCSIITELSSIILIWISSLIELKFSIYSLVLLAITLISSLLVFKTFITTHEVSLKYFLFDSSFQTLFTLAISLIFTILSPIFLTTISEISDDEYFLLLLLI